MNKTEKLLALLFGIALVGWIYYSAQVQKKAIAARASQVQVASTNETAAATQVVPPADTVITAPVAQKAEPVALVAPTLPEEVVALSDNDVEISFSSWGGVIRSVALKGYDDENGDGIVTLGDPETPALRLEGLPGIAPNASYSIAKDGTNAIVFSALANGLSIERRVELLGGFQIAVKDTFKNSSDSVMTLETNSVSIGVFSRGTSVQDLLSIDSLPVNGKQKVKYWGSDKVVGSYLVGGNAGGFGCGRAPSAVGLPPSATLPVYEPQQWLALKSRFFLAALETSAPTLGFSLTAGRDTAKPTYYLQTLSANVLFPGQVLAQGQSVERSYRLFIGPKKLSLLQKFGAKLDDVTDFGMWSWLCKLLVPTLNAFHWLVPNYGVAVILLTFLVRLIFWPLTRKSTVGMKKMQELQPKLKELQAKYKDNPQRLQQETWALYRDNKVNPLSSCLPMLIQIPVFIALFYVLRNSVELRHAPFLWIRDLSEPENLLAGVLPIPLNILPILMAGTMALQSYLTPSAGDPKQQRMMMVLMPTMMLFMFYSFPSALSLYWTVSQILAIIQMVLIHRKGKTEGTSPDSSPMTRQQRRHAGN